MSKTKKISFLNLKGGVGKTNLSVNFAAYCGQILKKKTLMIDMDHQTNATFAMVDPDEWKKHADNKGTVAHLLGIRRHMSAGERKTVDQVIMKEVFENVDLIPSHLELYTADIDLASAPARERRLSRAIEPIQNEYEYIIIDCPPNLNIATQNALASSDYYVVPVSPDYLSAIGVGLLLSRIDEIAADLDHSVTNAGIVFSRVGRPSYHREAIKNDLRAKLAKLMINNEIKERTAYSEAVSEQRSIFDKTGEASQEFRMVADEIIKRLK